jgi:hypothetical protein
MMPEAAIDLTFEICGSTIGRLTLREYRKVGRDTVLQLPDGRLIAVPTDAFRRWRPRSGESIGRLSASHAKAEIEKIYGSLTRMVTRAGSASVAVERTQKGASEKSIRVTVRAMLHPNAIDGSAEITPHTILGPGSQVTVRDGKAYVPIWVAR